MAPAAPTIMPVCAHQGQHTLSIELTPRDEAGIHRVVLLVWACVRCGAHGAERRVEFP